MTERTPQGRFVKGQSGNPAGRPKSASTALREQLSEHGVAVVDKVVEAAVAGDMTACKLVLDRISPALKATAAPVSIELPENAGLAGTASAFVEAASDGRLPPDVAATLVQAVSGLAKIEEIDELERRLAALEAQA